MYHYVSFKEEVENSKANKQKQEIIIYGVPSRKSPAHTERPTDACFSSRRARAHTHTLMSTHTHTHTHTDTHTHKHTHTHTYTLSPSLQIHAQPVMGWQKRDSRRKLQIGTQNRRSGFSVFDLKEWIKRNAWEGVPARITGPMYRKDLFPSVLLPDNRSDVPKGSLPQCPPAR